MPNEGNFLKKRKIFWEIKKMILHLLIFSKNREK